MGTDEHRDGDTPMVRPRRLRATASMRRLVSETRLHAADLVLPIFVREGLDAPHPIDSLPGVHQHTLESLVGEVERAAAMRVGGVLLYAVPETRDAEGSAACDPEGILSLAVSRAKTAAGGQLVVMADLCMDGFTDHGHCGVVDSAGNVDNDATLAVYRKMAEVLAEAGADILGLSGMMDGQVAAVRDALESAGHHDTALLAYAAKYASAFYGPFRDAVESPLEGHRLGYQMDPANGREAMREVTLDLEEGADIVMVKPALPYLDVLAEVAAESDVPVAAYHVSGEYASIEAAATRGWLDRRAAHLEAFTSMARAGADIVVSYAALDLATWIREDTR